MNIVPVAAFNDNYIWALCDDRHAVVVDPGDAAPVQAFLAHSGRSLAAILVTHHHPDHVGGIEELTRGQRLPVYGPSGEPIAALTHAVAEGDTVTLPELDIAFTVLDIPGHTRAHIAYYRPGTLFCGDTLFACGCGRVFEGTMEQMYASLQKLAALPGDTRVYCAHEYTLANIRFALAVEPHNAALQARAERERARRESGEPTLPSTLAAELDTNPFLRCSQAAVIAAASARQGRPLGDPLGVFAAIREWKNRF